MVNFKKMAKRKHVSPSYERGVPSKRITRSSMPYFQSLVQSIVENRIDDFKQLLGSDDETRKTTALIKFQHTYPRQLSSTNVCVYEIVVRYYRYEMLAYLLQLGIGAVNYAGFNALITCIEHAYSVSVANDRLKCAQLLLQNSDNIDYCIMTNTVPLFYAAQLRSLEIMKIILKHPNIDVNVAPNATRCTPLMKATRDAHAAHVRLFVQHKTIVVRTLRNATLTALHVIQYNECALMCIRQLLHHRDMNVCKMDRFCKKVMRKTRRNRMHHVWALLTHGRV
jgi:hypothetical protein